MKRGYSWKMPSLRDRTFVGIHRKKPWHITNCENEQKHHLTAGVWCYMVKLQLLPAFLHPAQHMLLTQLPDLLVRLGSCSPGKIWKCALRWTSLLTALSPLKKKKNPKPSPLFLAIAITCRMWFLWQELESQKKLWWGMILLPLFSSVSANFCGQLDHRV